MPGPWRDDDAGSLREAWAVAHDHGGDGDLAHQLYAHWYARPAGPVLAPGPWAAPVAGICRAAHAAARRWASEPEPVVASGVAGVAVVQGPRRRAVTRGEYVTASGAPGLAPTTSTTLRVLDRHGGQVSDGWWRTWGPGWDGEAELVGGVSRVYLAPVAPEVGRLVHAVTGVLDGNDGHGCWAFKVGVDPSTLARADGAVVYVPDRHREAVLAPLVAAARPFVRGGRPPLTRALAPGISWAQDPGDGDSYGEQVCRLVALAAVGDEAGFLDRLAGVLRSRGLDPGDPQLRARRAAVRS